LSSLSDEAWKNHIDALVVAKLEKDKTLVDESGRHWKDIINHAYRFDRAEKEVEILGTVTREEVLSFYKKYIAPDAPKRRYLSSHIFTAASEAQFKELENHEELSRGFQEIKDYAEFVRTQKPYPFPPYKDEAL